MPLYELALLVRPTKKDEILACLKRAAKLVWQANGTISKIEFQGYNELPHRIKSEEDYATKGSYFIYYCSLGSDKLRAIYPEFKLDSDFMKANFIEHNASLVPRKYKCTLPEELLPPSFRPSVQPLLKAKNFRPTIRR